MFDELLFTGRVVFIEDSGGSTRDYGRMTGKPHLTACFSDWSRHAASDSGIWQSRPLRIKWQDWIAPGGRINSSSGMPPVAG
jgi:hypothetical protein